ncbi:hypothetical protein OCU04_012527 [Sclerotinia nivalis]|uniref:Major facilitator superfamily (MFS) profile domain-containing protein n=1 Tax=Sclerotinia nivalis TaxID=352851 RepID=A0A9X0DDC0_9HELO|nr:hypothetical protein OCU04_012527 [Sclerotinia nivalis]
MMIRTSDLTIEATPPSPPKTDVDDNENHGKHINYTHESTSTVEGHDEKKQQFSIMIENCFAKFWGLITYTPKRCRYDPESPPKFSMALNLLFAFACTFTVANLYYSHPILNILAAEFNVSNERASIIPTVMQAGYAAGLLFICPLGDIYKRRGFVLILVFCTATMWLGLCLTNSFPVFVGISFLAALTTVTPQLMLPLVGDLAPPDRRATCLAIVSSGLLLGLLIARLLSGILTQYTTWRTIYWFSFSLQYLLFTLLYLFMPDYPSTNPGSFNYLSHLHSILHLFLTQPLLIQASLIGLTTSTLFTTYWTTLTFLLSSPPYSLPPLPISLFSLLGILTLLLSPLYSHLIIDKFVPLFSSILGLLYCLIGICIGTFTADLTIAGPILQAIFLDIGINTCMIANRCAVYAIDAKMRNRINTVYMGWVFVGQLVGTAVGNTLFARYGWRGSGGVGLGFVALGLLCAVVRGPWEKGWMGWGGGWGVRRKDFGGEGELEEVVVERVVDELRDEEMGEGGKKTNGVDIGEKQKEKDM